MHYDHCARSVIVTMDDQGPSHPLREAARRAGVSVPTLRRRIRAGELQAVLRRGPFGEQWEVPEAELTAWAETRRSRRSNDYGHEYAHEHDPIMVEEGDVDNRSTAERWALERAGYWRGRWEELREVLEMLRNGPTPAPREEVPADEIETLKEALRQKTQELVHARNLLDSLRREKARVEEELQALRDRFRSGEVTVAEMDPPRPRLPRV